MNETEKQNLRVNRVEFVNNLEATDILDYLLEDGIFTENDCELISNSKTRRERAQLLLAMLPTRGPNAYGSFRRALNLGNYDFLDEKLSHVQKSNYGTIELSQKDDSKKPNDLQRCMEIVSGCKNEIFKCVLKKNVFLLVDNVEPKDIIDFFCQEQIVSEDEVELIKAGNTRKERCFVFIRELSRSSSNTLVQILQKSLEKKYNFIKKSIEKTIENGCHGNINNNQVQSVTSERNPYDLNHTERKQVRVPSQNTDIFIETRPNISGQTPSCTPCKEIKSDTEIFDRTETKELANINTANQMHVPNENTEYFTKTNSMVSGNTPCKKIHDDTEIFDQTKTKKLNDTMTTNEMRVPNENTELFTELYSNASGHTSSGISCKQTNSRTEVFGQTEAKCITHTETALKQVPGSVCKNGPCEHEICSFSKQSVQTMDPGQQLEFSLLSSGIKTNSTSTKDLTMENCSSVPALDLHSACSLDPASLDNVADSAGILPKREVCDVSRRDTYKTESKILYLTQNSTDSEAEECKTMNKPRRKPNNSKKKLDTRVGISKSEKYSSRQGIFEANNLERVDDELNDPSTFSSIEQNTQNVYVNSISKYQPNTTNQNLPGRHLVMTFNYLSTLINQGNFGKFELFSSNLHRRYAKDADMLCLLGYLHASRDLFKTDFDSAKKHIDRAFEIVPKTSNPKYFTLELFTTKTRMYITQKKLEKLENALDDAKMIIETDPMGCTGRAAGWLYMNDARNCTAQIGLLNFRHPKAITSYTKLHKRAKASFEKALINFQRDGGKDGPFGFGYALCRLAILLLQCGDNGRTMDVLLPPEEDIILAGEHLKHLEDSEIAIPKILEMHFVLAKCDYQFRRKNTIRALEYAELGHEIASELKLFEFTEHAHNRCVFLRTKTPLVIDDVSEEEFTSILFGDTVESQSSE